MPLKQRFHKSVLRWQKLTPNNFIMKVLFVSSGNFYLGITSVIQRQADSLKEKGVNVSPFHIKGKGIRGYLANVKYLRSVIKAEKPDVVHAHYSLSAYIAVLSGARPLVVSLMGSDVGKKNSKNIVVKWCHRLFWKKTIVKSEQMRLQLGLKDVLVVPNGVDLTLFFPMNQSECRQKLQWDQNKKYFLFAANPSRTEKNYALAEKAFQHLNSENAVLKSLSDVLPEDVPVWMNAADVVLLTSLKEGSPNVIKEAMACNKTVVATDVGDIQWLFGDEPGHYISNFDISEVCQNMENALKYSSETGLTNGRNRIIQLNLDAEKIADQIIEIYRNVIRKK
jgi:teichuronic acid biosynthesis glycosyltransferase TuaC